MTQTEAPGTAARSVAVMAAARAGWLSSSRPLPGVNTSPNVVRPPLATNPRSPADAYDTTRTAESFLATAPKPRASPARTPGLSTVVPAGRVMTGTSGADCPPLW